MKVLKKSVLVHSASISVQINKLIFFKAFAPLLSVKKKTKPKSY